MTTQTLRETLRNPPKPSAGLRRVDVEALVIWAYADQRAHQVTAGDVGGGAIGPAGLGRTNAAVVTGALALGCVVDGGGVAPALDLSRPVARDALAVDALVRELDAADPTAPLSGMVIHHALAGSRPETFAGITPRPVARRLGRNDRPAVVYADARSRKPLYCPVDYVPAPRDIDAARLMYLRWWVAMDWLAEWLPEVLQDHEITGFSAPREPWADGA